MSSPTDLAGLPFSPKQSRDKETPKGLRDHCFGIHVRPDGALWTAADSPEEGNHQLRAEAAAAADVRARSSASSFKARPSPRDVAVVVMAQSSNNNNGDVAPTLPLTAGFEPHAALEDLRL